VLRVVPELERSGDLAEHIASRAAHGLGAHLSPKARGLVEQMGDVGVRLWRAAGDAWADQDVGAAGRLEALDDELDDLSRRLCEEATTGTHEPEAILQLGLVARFYERLGDHAVHIAERIPYLVTGLR
jgi:phosphate transport system protein